MSEENAAREMTALEKAAAGGVGRGGGQISTAPHRSNIPGQISTGPQPPFRLWQKGLEEEIGMLEKTIEQLESQLGPYLMPQSEPDGLPKEVGNTPLQSELTGWLQAIAQSVKNLRALVERISQRLEV